MLEYGVEKLYRTLKLTGYTTQELDVPTLTSPEEVAEEVATLHSPRYQ